MVFRLMLMLSSMLVHVLGMQISVKTLSDQIITLDVEPTDSVLEIKEKLFRAIETEGIEVDRMRLIFASKPLDDDRQRLQDINITAGAVLHMTLK